MTYSWSGRGRSFFCSYHLIPFSLRFALGDAQKKKKGGKKRGSLIHIPTHLRKDKHTYVNARTVAHAPIHTLITYIQTQYLRRISYQDNKTNKSSLKGQGVPIVKPQQSLVWRGFIYGGSVPVYLENTSETTANYVCLALANYPANSNHPTDWCPTFKEILSPTNDN